MGWIEPYTVPRHAVNVTNKPIANVLRFFVSHCAAEAVFCYTAENSHHLRRKYQKEERQEVK
jgi:hypothetical protein